MKGLYEMKKTVIASVAFAAIGAFAAAPTVSEVEVTQAKNRDVSVSYLLSGGPAFVTAEMVTGGSVASPAMTNVTGDVNCVVPPGRRSFLWKARKDWPDVKAQVSARVMARPSGLMPDYLVVDLKTPNVRSWYATSNDVPGGVTSMVYKTDKLVMRRIPARNVIWRMGQPAGGELCQGESYSSARTLEWRLRDNETGHKVMLTEDFYMGIYELTTSQYRKIAGLSESSIVNPVGEISVNALRGAASGTFSGGPADGYAVADGSVLRKLRNLTGIESFDLPTEAQWEFACRAGTSTSLNSGKDAVDTASGHGDANMAEVGWSQYNEPKLNAAHEVGLLKPNAFGLYDMHGNLAERCLDWQTEGDDYRATFAPGWERGAVTVDPIGPASGTYRIVRGGDHFYSSAWARSAARAIYTHLPDVTSARYGIRLVCSASAD